jgi:electron transfer flavoprotein alpha subunit
MRNVFVYCELLEDNTVADVSLELLTKGKSLAEKLGVKLEAVLIGSGLNGVEKQVYKYGVDVAHIADDKRLAPYTTLPHTSIISKLLKEKDPQIVLFGASSVGRDLAPRVASAVKCGLTADCTSLEIGDHYVKRPILLIKIYCIKFVLHLVVISLQQLSIPTCTHRWQLFVKG